MKRFMKMLTIGAMLALMLVYCTGCSSCERLARLCPPQVSKTETVYRHDTTVITRWQTDTALSLALEREYSRVSALYRDTAHAETLYATADAWVTGERIELALANKFVAPVRVPIYHELENNTQQEVRVERITEIQTVYRTRGIVKCGAWIGLATVIWLLCVVVYKLISRFAK